MHFDFLDCPDKCKENQQLIKDNNRTMDNERISAGGNI